MCAAARIKGCKCWVRCLQFQINLYIEIKTSSPLGGSSAYLTLCFEMCSSPVGQLPGAEGAAAEGNQTLQSASGDCAPSSTHPNSTGKAVPPCG